MEISSESQSSIANIFSIIFIISFYGPLFLVKLTKGLKSSDLSLWIIACKGEMKKPAKCDWLRII